MLIKVRINIKIFSLCFLLIALSFLSTPVKTQDNTDAGEFCNHPLIRTILLYRSGWALSMPVIKLQDNEMLEFRYDFMGEPDLDFSYAISKCRYDWEINDISEHYYLEGFNDIPIYDFQPSRNTTKYFTHYSAILPNDDLKITRSGNYLLNVYDSSDPDSILISRRFAVVDPKVEITGLVKRPDNEHQEILLRIDIKNLNLIDHHEEIKVVILKNYDWNNQVIIQSKPILGNKVLHYDKPYQILAEGGNEFRSIDSKDTRFISNGVDDIEYLSPYFWFFLTPDKLRQYDPYFSDTDLNGRSFYEIPDAQDRHLDADYVQVHFKLETIKPLGSDVYIYGALTDWKTDKSNFMIFNPDEGVYEASLLIKQGMLNYAYAMRDYNSQEIHFDITEGNQSETENDYLVFVYFRSITGDFDELVGFEIINSMEKSR